jgi:hypothetical protein
MKLGGPRDGLEVMTKIKIHITSGTQTAFANIFQERRKSEMPVHSTNKANTAPTDVNSFVTARDIFMENNGPSFEYWDVTKKSFYIVTSCFKLRLAIRCRLGGLYREDESSV